MPDKNEDWECSNCGGEASVKEFDTPVGTHITEKKVRLCVYCSGSCAGNSFFYPRQYNDPAILRGFAAMMNILEERLKQK